MKAKNLLEVVHSSVRRYPDKDALMWKSNGNYRGISYRDFWEEVRQAAAGLAHLGVDRGDKVAILSENNQKWPVSDLAILSLGAVVVPIYPTLPKEQVAFILQNADCKVAIVEDEEQMEKVQQGDAEVEHIIVIKPGPTFERVDQTLSFADLENTGKKQPLKAWEEKWQDIDREQLATIIHTSGTTGLPKGAMLTHGNFLANMEAIQFWCLEARADDVMLSYLPLSHVFERMAGQFMPLSVGSTIAYAESIDTIPDNLQEVKPTVMTSVPRLFEKVYARVQEQIEAGTPLRRKIFDWAVNIGKQRYDYYVNQPMDQLITGELPPELRRKWKLADRLVYQKVKSNLGGRLRGMVSGGAALNREIASFFWAIDIPVLEGYGLTETSPVIATNPMARTKIGTVGKPLPNLDVRIAPDGEVLVKGPSVMKGYYKNEEATKEQIVDGWFRTGDIGEIDEEGYLKIVDRKKRLLILSTGKNVAPQQVENAINQSIFIENSVVVGQDRKYLVALIVPDYENLIPWARKHGIHTEAQAKLVQNKKIQHLLQKEVERHTGALARHEQPKKVIVIGREWTVESGELTPTLKARFKDIEKRYEDIIHFTYSESAYMQIDDATDEVAATVMK